MTSRHRHPNPPMDHDAPRAPQGRVGHRRGHRAKALRRPGFTLVEVLVSVAIISILLIIISQVLASVREGISVATADMEITNYAAAMEGRLRDDVRRMDTTAFLVIKNQVLFVDYDEPGTGASDSAIDPTWALGSGGASSRPSEIFGGDQLLFFANGPFRSQRYGLHTASGAAAGDTRGVTAPTARIWWGHLSPDTDGRPPMDVDRVNPILPFQWRLGRHALLMAGNWVAYESPTGGTDIVGSYTPWSTVGVTKPAPAAYNLGGGATSLDYRGLLQGDSDIVTGMTMADVKSIVRQNRFKGTTITADTSDSGNNPPVQRAPEIGWVNSRHLVQIPALLSSPPSSEFLQPITDLYEPRPWNTVGNTAGERDRMIAAVFRPFGDPQPDIFTGNQNDQNDNLMTAESIIAPHCSSITIEFAGDYAQAGGGPGADGNIDRKSNPPNNVTPASPNGPQDGEIYWYGGLELDVDPSSIHYGRRRGINQIWFFNPNFAQIDQYLGPGTPQTTPFAGYAAAFGYDKTETPWPKLLRITVTLQDQRGRLYDRYLNSSGQEPQGRTYVFIVKVPE